MIACTVQEMARVLSGQAPAWPLVSDRSVRSRVKRSNLACTFARHFPPVLVGLRSGSRLGLEGRARTLSGPSPALTSAARLWWLRPQLALRRLIADCGQALTLRVLPGSLLVNRSLSAAARRATAGLQGRAGADAGPAAPQAPRLIYIWLNSAVQRLGALSSVG